MNLVIDASIVIKLYVPEILAEKAEELFYRVERDEIILIAPDLLYAETGNILWKKYRLQELTTQEVKEISDAIVSLPLRIEPSRPLIQLAIDLGIAYDITVYDALYVSTAKIYETKLVTADRKLIDVLKRTPLLKYVEWLGA